MSGEFTADQWRFIEWRAAPRFTRLPPTQEMLAAEIGVDDSTLRRWSKLEGFQEEVMKLVRAGLTKSLPSIYGALITQAEAGDYQCIKLALEMSKEYTPTQKNLNQTDMKGDVTIRFVEDEAAIDGDE